MGNKYWLTHPDCERGVRLLTRLPTLEIAQRVGGKYGDETQITRVDNDNKFQQTWVLNGTWKELKFIP